MADYKSPHMAAGEVEGTGSSINIICGFKPKAVWIKNVDGEAELFYNASMTDGYGYKTLGGTAGGTAAAQVFTGTAPTTNLNLASPAFSGTGFTTAGQVVTTTDNQTMTLNQCAGMWLIADALASTAPVLIVSNTAVTGAPAVLTVIGTAPVTDAGTYKIVKHAAPVGTNASSTVTAGSGNAALITSLGITPFFNGFTIGADTDINVSAETINWVAIK